MAGLSEMFIGEGRVARVDAILANQGVLECAAALEQLAKDGNEGAHQVLVAANRIVDLERQLSHRITVIGRMTELNSERLADITRDVNSVPSLMSDAYEYEQLAIRHSEARRAFRAVAKLWSLVSVTEPPAAPTLVDLVREVEQHPLVQAVKDHALQNYEAGGWDVVVETYENVEIARRLAKAGAATAEEAIAEFAPSVSVWADRQADARNSAF